MTEKEFDFDFNITKNTDGWTGAFSGVNQGIVVFQGDTIDEAIDDMAGALKQHLELFGGASK